jgi:hypothetical protein
LEQFQLLLQAAATLRKSLGHLGQFQPRLPVEPGSLASPRQAGLFQPGLQMVSGLFSPGFLRMVALSALGAQMELVLSGF